MCELLGMSANVPTDICFSFSGLLKRGGETGPHKDGWGITFYEGKGCRSFKDPQPSSRSRIAQLVKNYPIKSKVVISHIRQANRGGVSLENTHPFTRQLWGQNWTYAHNGQLTDHEKLPLGRTLPIGETDSEYAFCWIIEQLYQTYNEAPKDMLLVFKEIASYAHKLRQLGVFNMLLTNGEYMMCYCTNNLHWITRCAPFGQAQLIDADMVVDFQKETTHKDVVTLIATRPLTSNEQWNKMHSGEFCVFHLGKRIL
ncbi:glutamine amidotransferase, class-II [Psychromonas sp. CNPT3]|uniref:class II glutamine amidotransferase n=1 Tax=Psychromonas sp. CNPT3 TaxID=314282 RepID=UPI00006E80D3|nr:class II glutamine amidotransferase [Psychromonas sp. CNPT3]AGH80806.1 glutamine amidotransferase, class-II [Psychromonas sp. CNPT3]